MLLGILLTLLIIVCVAMTGVILLQRSEGGALGMGGGGGFMTARGTSDLLTRTTQVLGTLFFVLSIAITILVGRTSGSGLIDESKIKALDTQELQKGMAPPPQPQLPGAPGAPGGFGAPAPGAPAGQPITLPPAPVPQAPTQ